MLILYLLILTALLILLIALGAYLKAFHAPKFRRGRAYPLPGGEQYARVKDQTDALRREMQALPCEEICITAPDGTRLCGGYYHLADGAPLQIQFHGYRGSRHRDFCGGHKLARELGHNTLVVDQRAHGNSGSRTITFGIRERRDCLAWVDYALQRFGRELPILLSGVSMGAATVLMASGLPLPENVRGVIADSPYSAPEKIIRKVCRDMHLPPKLSFPFVRLGGRIFGGFDITEASALQAVQHTRLPILILHGEDDRFVPCSMSREIRSANPESVTLETFPGAGHGLSYVSDPQRYRCIVSEFVQRCLNGRT